MLKTFIGTYIPDFNSIPSAVLEKKFHSLLYNSKPNLAEMFSMRSYTRVVIFVQIRQKTWPPCDFENSD
jgi:hypothetical protein